MEENSFYKYKILTKKAYEFMTRALNGDTIKFTKVKIGNGIVENQDLYTLSDVLDYKFDAKIVGINKQDVDIILDILLSSEDVVEPEQFREIGVYAKIEDEEVLYFYLNSGEKFDFLYPIEGAEYMQQRLQITIRVGSADKTTIELNNLVIPINSISEDNLVSQLRDKVNSIREEQLNNDLKNKINMTEELKNDYDNHKQSSVVSDQGVHNLRYDVSSQRLEQLNGLRWTPLDLYNKDVEILKYALSEKISDNVFLFTKFDLDVTGGCYNAGENKYYINDIN